MSAGENFASTVIEDVLWDAQRIYKQHWEETGELN